MWDSFVLWGQAYGLWTTLAILIVYVIMQSFENRRIAKALENERRESKAYQDMYERLLQTTTIKNDRDN